MIREIKQLNELGEREQVAVIINCGTKDVTTLALMSALAHARMAVLVIDCESQDGSREHFQKLSLDHHLDFMWLSWPLRRHGQTLDRLFREVPAKRVLLVDSDIEIPNDKIISEMLTLSSTFPHSYGAGYQHGPSWLGSEHGLAQGVGFYKERMWIPLVLLKTDAVRLALSSGISFLTERHFTDLPRFQKFSSLLALRAWLPGLRRIGRRSSKPIFLEYDTGAKLHEYLLQRQYCLAEVTTVDRSEVLHFHGVTRAAMRWWHRTVAEKVGLMRPTNNAASKRNIDDVLRQRLASYGIG